MKMMKVLRNLTSQVVLAPQKIVKEFRQKIKLTLRNPINQTGIEQSKIMKNPEILNRNSSLTKHTISRSNE